RGLVPGDGLGEGAALFGGEVGDAVGGEGEQRVEFGAGEGNTFGRALHFDEPAAAGHHDVHVGVGADVFLIRQVDHGHTADDPDGDGCHGVGEDCRLGRDRAVLFAPGNGVGKGDVGPGNRGGAGAAVGLEYVAVDDDRVLAEGFGVDDRAQGAADEARDLVGAAADLAAHGLA